MAASQSSDDLYVLPKQAHLRLIAAAARGNEAALRNAYSELPAWESPQDIDALRHALQKAAGKGSWPVFQLLLEWGANVHAVRSGEVPALFKAVEGGRQAMVTELFRRGAEHDWYRPKDGVTALFIACLRGFEYIVKDLLEAGADPNTCDKEGRTPLIYSVAQRATKCTPSIFKMLIQYGANMEARDHSGQTALLKAASIGHAQLVEMFLSGELGQRADISAKKTRGQTIVYLAAEKNHPSVVEVLLNYGADPNVAADGGWRPIHSVARGGHVQILIRLLEAGVSVNAQLSNGMTPLHLAATNGHFDVVEVLLAQPSVILDIKDSFNRTPMICAALIKRKDVAQLLSPTSVSHRLSASKAAACKSFEAMIVDFGEFREKRLRPSHSVWDLLYGLDEYMYKPKVPISPRNVKYRPDVRWIHLPANNVHWVETLFARLLAEEGFQDVESFRSVIESLHQEQQGSLESGYSMRPVCQRNTHSRSSSGTGVSTPPLKPKTGSIVLFVPFIHYETLDRYRKMEATVAQVRRNGRPVSATPDAQLIQGYLESDRPLHVRRDLDKYHNDRVDTTARAADQVTARSDRKQHTILMLDQLWLWVIGKDMVVSCFAERWEQPSTDPLNVRDSILDALKGEQNITSNYHLATLILTHSYNILDSIRVSQTHKFMNLFESSIKTVVDRQDRLLANFYQISHRSSNWLRSNRKHHGIPTRMDQDGDHDYVLDALLDLSEETTILSEVNDIRDEINIVEDVVSTQKSILQEFEALVTEELQDREEEDIGAVMTQLKMRWRALGRRIDTRQRDLNRMSRRAENSHSSLRSLLELKQMQSNALEAKFARNQAVTTSKQGQAVLVFTIVTIIFLPMSFIATLFTVELSEWPNPLTLSYMAKYTFGIGLGISIPLVVIAMTVSDVVATVKAFFLGDHRLFRALRG